MVFIGVLGIDFMSCLASLLIDGGLAAALTLSAPPVGRATNAQLVAEAAVDHACAATCIPHGDAAHSSSYVGR